MLTTDDYYNAAPADRNALKRELGEATHRGPDNWAHDIAASNERAFQALAAMKANQPRPTYGAHRGVPRSA